MNGSVVVGTHNYVISYDIKKDVLSLVLKKDLDLQIRDFKFKFP